MKKAHPPGLLQRLVGQRPEEIPFGRTVSQANPDPIPFCVGESPALASGETKPVLGVTKGRLIILSGLRRRLITLFHVMGANPDSVRLIEGNPDPIQCYQGEP